MNETHALHAAEVSVLAHSLQAGAPILAAENQQLARRLNTATLGIASISSGIAIWGSATPILSGLGPLGIAVGIGAIGMSLFGRDDHSGRELSAYLQARFDQIVVELEEIKRGIIEIDQRAEARHQDLCQKIDRFQQVVFQLHQQTRDCFFALERQLQAVSNEHKRQFNALTIQLAIQAVGDFSEKLAEKLRALGTQENHFQLYLREDGVVTDTLHEKFQIIYEMISASFKEDILDYQDLDGKFHTPAHRLTYLKTHSHQIDLYWLCAKINIQLKTLMMSPAVPIQQIELASANNIWMNQPLLEKRVDLLLNVLEKRYLSQGHQKIPKAACELVQGQQFVVTAHLELLRQLLSKNIPQFLVAVYLNQVSSGIVQTIKDRISLFEQAQTELARKTWEEKVRVVEHETDLFCQRLTQGEFAANQGKSAKEICGYATGCDRASSLPNILDSFELCHDGSKQREALAKSHADRARKIFFSEKSAMDNTRGIIHVSLTRSLESKACSVGNMMLPDQETAKQGFNFLFIVPQSITQSLPSIAIEVVQQALGVVNWQYTVSADIPAKMTVTAILTLIDKRKFSLLSVEIENPIIAFHDAHPLYIRERARLGRIVFPRPPVKITYSNVELWLLFLHGGHYARECRTIAFLINRVTSYTSKNAPHYSDISHDIEIPIFPLYEGFLSSENGIFEGQQCLTILSSLTRVDEVTLREHQDQNLFHQQFQQELRQSFSEGGLHEVNREIIDETFYVLVALIEFLQPNDYAAMIHDMKRHHEVILKSIEHGLEGLEEAQQGYAALLLLLDLDRLNFTPSDTHPLLTRAHQLEVFLSGHTPSEALQIGDKPSGISLSLSEAGQIEEAAETWMKSHLKYLLIKGGFQEAAKLVEGDPVDSRIQLEGNSQILTHLVSGIKSGLLVVQTQLLESQEYKALDTIVLPEVREARLTEEMIRNRCALERGLPAGPSSASAGVSAAWSGTFRAETSHRAPHASHQAAPS